MSPGTKVVGYVRVSTTEQADSGAGLSAQRTAIELACQQRDWTLVQLIEDASFSASTLARPGLSVALELVEARDADVLVVAKLDRLSRSLVDFASVMQRSRKRGWALVALDLGVDTTTPQGEMLANVLASFAQFERRLIGQRTAEALAAKRAAGVRLGRPRSLPDEVVGRIWRSHRRGASLRVIAARLNRDGVATAHGGARWHPSTVAAVLVSVRNERDRVSTPTGAGR